MGFRRAAVLTLALFPCGAGAAWAGDGADPRPGVEMKGTIQFPRPQAMSIRTDDGDGSRLTVMMGFDGRCHGGGLGELWSANVTSRPAIRVQGGRFAANLTGTVRRLGGLGARSGDFRWRIT